MSKQKSPQEERAIIVGQPNKRPYGVRVRIHLQTAGALGNVEAICVTLATGAFLTISPAGGTAPWEGGKKFLVTLEGFPTAASAEAAGRRLVQALLWMAISTDAPLRLEYLSYEPASVFERNRSTGISCNAFATVGYSPTLVFGELHDAYSLLDTPDEKLLLSMEIFCAARLESSQRAIFLALVSALEPLACEELLGVDVDSFINVCITQLKASKDVAPDLRASLEGRLYQLRKESIRQALKRLAKETLPNQPDAAHAIDEAYSLRSQIIHSGVPDDLDTDLERESRLISNIIRRMYASILKRKLARDG